MTTPRNPIRITQSNLKFIECPICREVPNGRIFECVNGHATCEICCFRVNKCPFCQACFSGWNKGEGRIRARTLECMLDTMTYECPNKKLGCQELLKREDINHHLQNNCIYEPPAPETPTSPGPLQEEEYPYLPNFPTQEDANQDLDYNFDFEDCSDSSFGQAFCCALWLGVFFGLNIYLYRFGGFPVD